MIGRRRRAAAPTPSVVDSAIGGHNIQVGSATGDVVILLDRPDYRLEFLTPTPAEVDHLAARSRRAPSYLLDPQREVVGYRSRPIEEQQVQDWLDSPEAVSVLLVTGPGGQGKTRLAGHVASACYEAGWAVAQAVERSPRLRTGQATGQGLGDGRALLVVLDYADRWRLGVLAQLVEALPLDYPRRRVRVLLLARPGPGLWDTIAAELDRSGVDLADPIPLGELGGDRAAVFTDAAAAFAQRLEVSVPPAPAAATLADPGYGSPLALHMAALAAVWGARGHQDVPSRPEELSRFLLRHERRYWAGMEGRVGVAGVEVLEQLVVLGTLLGPVRGRNVALGLLRRARLADGDAHAAGLLTGYERLYPPQRADPAGGAGVMEVATLLPLRPDRLGEDLVGHHLAANPHTGPLLAELLGEPDPRVGVDGLALRRCLIVLAAAAARHDAAATSLFALLQHHPALAARAAAAVVQLVVERAPDTVAVTVEAGLPRYSTELLRPAAALAHRMYDALPGNATPAQRAHRLTILGVRLAAVGDKRAALAPTEEAVAIRRRLAEAEPAAYLPALAMSLWAFGWVRAAGLHELDDALAAVVEAVAIYRSLAEELPLAFTGYLRAAISTQIELLDG
ncbi:MAG: hypothetical protein ACRDT0_27105, partial [Pseudonocardiaceae bacterium]